jgi:hypothetical protein
MKMKKEQKTLFEKSDAVKELESLKEAFNSERLRWLIGHDIPESMDEEQYDEIVEQVMVEEKVRSIIFRKARELGMDKEIKEFIVYHYGDKTIMGVDRDVLDEAMKDIKEKGPYAIKGVELLPNRLWLVV